jgi:8-oxo-dGTP pyrophosphatase MutT (NUDIX family)
MRLTENQIRDAFQHSQPASRSNFPSSLPKNSLAAAAVLLPLFHHQEEWYLLFIKRAYHKGDRHSGQIAFPGGRQESGDRSLEDTALRETREEIGLSTSSIQIFGKLPDLITVTDYRVTPFVGLIPYPHNLTLSPTEVEKTISIPLTWLSNQGNFVVKNWTPDPDRFRPHEVIFYSRYKNEILWGATARMVRDLLQLLPPLS